MILSRSVSTSSTSRIFFLLLSLLSLILSKDKKNTALFVTAAPATECSLTCSDQRFSNNMQVFDGQPDEAVTGAAVRWKDPKVADTGWVFYAGVGNVGVGQCREQAIQHRGNSPYEYGGIKMPFTIEFNANTNILSATLDATDEFSLSANVASLRQVSQCTHVPPTSEWNTMTFRIKNSSSGTASMIMTDVVFDGTEDLGDFCVDAGENDQYITLPLSDGYFVGKTTTIKGNLVLCGASKDEYDKGERDVWEFLFYKAALPDTGGFDFDECNDAIESSGPICPFWPIPQDDDAGRYPVNFNPALSTFNDLCVDSRTCNSLSSCDGSNTCDCFDGTKGDKACESNNDSCNCVSESGFIGGDDKSSCSSGRDKCNFVSGTIDGDDTGEDVCSSSEFACNCQSCTITRGCSGDHSCNFNLGLISTEGGCGGEKSCNFNAYEASECSENIFIADKACSGSGRSCNGNMGQIYGDSSVCDSEDVCNCNRGIIRGVNTCKGKRSCNNVPSCVILESGCEDDDSCNFDPDVDCCANGSCCSTFVGGDGQCSIII